MNILITTGEWKSALTCMRSFAKAGHKVSLLSFSPFTPHFHSKFCHERIVGPKERQKNEFMAFVLGLVSQKQYDLLIPISDTAVSCFSQFRDELRKYTKIILSSPDSIAIAGNKDKTYRLALENNVPIPHTYFPKNLTDVEKIVEEVRFPCLAKEPQECGGAGNTYIEDKKGLISTFQKLNDQKKWALVQEYIIGKSCSLAGVCNHGKILNYFMYESLRKYPEKSGPSVYTKSIFNNKLLHYSTILAEKLSWTGPIHFEFMLTRTGEGVLIEINPRFPGSLQIANCCGIDLPLAFIKLAEGKNNSIPQKKYKLGIIYRSVFPQEINSCRENKKYILDFFINFFRPNFCYDFSLRDPKLIWWQLKQAKWTIFPEKE